MSLLLQPRLHMLERLLPALDWLAGRTAVKTAAEPAHLALGDSGEEVAFFYLRRKGFVVTARKWQSPKQPGDLDLIAWEGETLCFVEVKTRGSHQVAAAESAVDADKRRMIRRMARQYLYTLPEQPKAIRFDILSIYLESDGAAEIRMIPGAFGWSEPAHRWS